MHSRSIEFAKKYRVPLRVRPSGSDGPGTLIAMELGDEIPMVTGVALVRNEARVSLCDLPDQPGVMSCIFTNMARRKIPIDMVVQDVGTAGRAEVSFTVPQDDLPGERLDGVAKQAQRFASINNDLVGEIPDPLVPILILGLGNYGKEKNE